MSSPVEGSLEGLIGSDDYPAEALNRNEEGTVQFRISIDETGAVRDCVIEKSSGSAALDAQTCRLMWLRAKFKPARDKDGKPVADQKTAKIAWRIAELERPSEAWAMRSVLVLVAGSDPVCRVDAEGAMASHMVTEGPCPADALELSAELPSVPNARTEFIEEQRFAVGAEPHLAMVDGDRLVGSQLVQIEVDATGKLTSCKIIDNEGVFPPTFRGACSLVGKQYAPRKGSTGAPAPFTAYFITGAYFHPVHTV